MRPFNPFLQRRNTNIEVIVKTCPTCNGTGSIKEEGEESFCFKCGGSGEITEKKTKASTNPNNL